MDEVKSSASLVWNELRKATKKYVAGAGARAVAKQIVPAVHWFVEGKEGLLLPMSPAKTALSQTARTLGRIGTVATKTAAERMGETALSRTLSVASRALGPLAMVALNPTNRFPGSSAEKKMIQDFARRQDLEASRIRNQDQMRNTAFARQQDAMRRNSLQLRPPARASSPISLRAPIQRIQPFKLQRAPTLNTPFHVNVMRPPRAERINPFGLSVMGRPAGSSPFGLHLGTPQLRAPFIGR